VGRQRQHVDRATDLDEAPQGRTVFVGARREAVGVRDRGLDGAQRGPALQHATHVGHGDLAQLRAQIGEHTGGRLGQGDDLRIRARAVERRVDADPEPARAEHALVEPGNVVRHGVGQRGRIMVVAPCDRGKQRRGIGGAARHRSDVVERV
jgi:hypothetical protein